MPKMRSMSVTGHLAVAVDLDADLTIDVGLKLEPCAAVRDDLCAKKLPAALWHRGKVNTRRTHELGNDDALHAIHDERAARGHDREIAEIHLLLLLVARATVDQANVQRSGAS